MWSLRQLVIIAVGVYFVSISAITVFLLTESSRKQISNFRSDNLLLNRERLSQVDYLPNNSEYYLKDNANDQKICPKFPSELRGKLSVNSSYVPTVDEAIKAAGIEVVNGCYEPKNCISNQTVAIIIPYKNRYKHLITLLYHLHPILQRQSVRYCVFVPEQYDDGAFNKARVMNAGVLEILHESKYNFNCLIFHDVDMLLENDRNLLICGDKPHHLSPALDKFKYKTNYGTHFGGVGAVSVEHYKLVNGHSNRFYGWGGEDSDIELRFELNGIKAVSNDPSIGRYKMIPHEHPWYFNPHSGTGSFLKGLDTKRFDEDQLLLTKSDPSGMHNMKYSVKDIFRHKLYTKINIDVRTVLVNGATVTFSGNSNFVTVENPSITNARLNGTKNHIRGFGVEAGDRFPNNGCTYKRFEKRTVNVTLGEKINNTYDVVYHNLEDAKSKCTSLYRYCGSILEISPGVYLLRSTAYMHENILKYKQGRFPQSTIIEKHNDISVYVKICHKDVRHLQILEAPVILPTTSSLEVNVQHEAEIEFEIYNIENVKFYYSVSIYTAHKAIMQERETIQNTSLGLFDTLSVTYSNSVLFFSLDSESNSKTLVNQGNNIDIRQMVEKHERFQVKTPTMLLPLVPGCYVCESSVIDQHGSPYLKWKWWFEVRGENLEFETKLLERQFAKGKVGSTKFTEKLEQQFVKNLMLPVDLQLPDHVMKIIANRREQ